MAGIDIDLDVLMEFEEGLDPSCPEKSLVPAAVLGFGEISTVFEIHREGMEGYAFKRLPIFSNAQEMEAYNRIYDEYNLTLKRKIGVNIPPYGHAEFVTPEGRPVSFLIQSKLHPASIGNRAIELLTDEEIFVLVRLIMRELKKVWDYNLEHPGGEVGIDGQISNWSIVDFQPEKPRITGDSELLFLDTSTPLFHKEGAEQLDPELFLRSAPSFMVWIIRLLFLEHVMTRYYDFRLVTIDLIANFYKEQRPELIPGLLRVCNDFFIHEVPYMNMEPIGEKEIRSYYREDALIWRIYLSLRRIDRFIRTRILRRGYPYILPGKIRR